MNRQDRNRNNYDRDYNEGAGYNRNDEHYHSARNLTNEFEQEYRSHHRNMEDDRYDQGRNHGGMRQSYHEGNMGDAYERMREGSGNTRRDSDYNMNYGNRDRGSWGESRNRNQNWSDSDRYGASGRYSQGSENFDRDMRSSNRFGNQERSQRMEQGRGSRMNQDRMREGYGISDYGRMGQQDIHSSRGIPNAGITSSFEDDYGTDFDSNRSNRISSGNYGGYGSQGGGYGRNRDDRY